MQIPIIVITLLTFPQRDTLSEDSGQAGNYLIVFLDVGNIVGVFGATGIAGAVTFGSGTDMLKLFLTGVIIVEFVILSELGAIGVV